MNLIIKVSFTEGLNAEMINIPMNTDNIETIQPKGYTNKHKKALIKMVSGSTYYITEEVYEKLIKEMNFKEL